jgi:hypothetical protein
VTTEQVEALTRGLASLPAKIDVLVDYRFGSDINLVDGTWDYGVIASLAEPSDYPVYSGHPDHVAVSNDLVQPLVSELARVQIVV